MPETKEEIAAQRDALQDERDALQAENENLRGQLAAAGAARTGGSPVAAPAHTFELSEGDRQELAMRGVLAVGGRLRTRDEVRDMLGEDQRNVDLGTAEPQLPPGYRSDRGAVEGVDFVYPSVSPGRIDPAVAGTPGINGPAADADNRPPVR
jgi:hypothetical protein